MPPIYFETEAAAELQKLIQQIENQERKLFILCDENTRLHCLPKLKELVALPFFELLTVPSGENSKTIATATSLWEQLSVKGADKGSVLLCLGGGVITDLGGFVAATFKRGIDCIFVPTTLMAQVDAAIGGKNALNLGSAKNQIGTFYHPKAIFVFTQFLQMLPEKEMLSAYAEMLKHGLIADKDYWEELKNTSPQPSPKEREKLPSFGGVGGGDFGGEVQTRNDNLLKHIKKSVEIKTAICLQDEKEANIRKKLNFGHTVGHALEAFFLSKNTPLSHGEAVAMGIVAESYLSWQAGLLDKDSLSEIVSCFREKFVFPQLDKNNFPDIIRFMASDKKRINENFNFTFLNQIGSAVINQQAREEAVGEALENLKI